MTEDEVVARLEEAIVRFDENLATKTANEVVQGNLDPLKAVDNGLIKGLDIVGQRYEDDEIFLPELMMAANVFQAAMQILEPLIAEKGQSRTVKGVVVIGTVKGDIHKIGKDILTLLLRNGGYDVHDLGEDVDLFTFVETAQKIGAQAIGLSALLTSTLSGQKDVIEALKQNGVRENYLILVGGGAVTPEWAESIGADMYAENAQTAVRKLNELLTSGTR
jgi:corrinoid protein of di/trimethylamine methyltransferase